MKKNKDVARYEGWKGRKPNVIFLHTWGCLVKVNIPALKKRKLGPKTLDCVFLGYAQNNMAYSFLVVKSDSPDAFTQSWSRMMFHSLRTFIP